MKGIHYQFAGGGRVLFALLACSFASLVGASLPPVTTEIDFVDNLPATAHDSSYVI